MAPPRAIIFDLFDTLVDLRFDRLEAVEIDGRKIPSTLGHQHRFLEERGHAVPLDRYIEILGASDRALAAEYLKKGRELPTVLRFREVCRELKLDDPDLPRALTDVHMGELRKCAVTPTHHADTLARLSERFRIGLCSNFSDTRTAERILDEEGLLPSLHATTVSESVGIRKPRREIFEHVLAGLGVDAADAVHVGDRLKDDVDGASALGIRTVWINRRIENPVSALRAHDGASPTWTIEDLAELESLFDG